MMLRRLLLLAALFLPVCANAQDSARRAALRAAFDAADRGQLDLSQAARFQSDPLYPWLQASVLAKQVATVTPAAMQAVLDRLGDQPAGRWLRPAWLKETIRREDWPAFRAAWQGSDDLLLRCADLQSRIDRSDEAWIADARRLWLTGDSLPSRCDAPFARLASLGKLDDALRWQRIDLAIAEGEAGLVRFVGKDLAGGSALAQSYADYLAAPAATVPANWPADARSRAVVTAGLSGLARRDPAQARQLLDRLPAAAIDAGQRGQVTYQVALWSVASYLPDSAQRLAAVPESAYDDRLHEWRVREAISRRDDAAALAAIGRMGATQRGDSRWQYFEARLRERLGQSAPARELYAKAAQSPSFHGWLAADRLQQPYALCALEPGKDASLLARVAGNAGLARALDLFALDRPDPAAREWSAAVKAMNDAERRVAVQRAIAEGWFDRAVYGMGAVPDDLRHYSLRFPLHHAADIREHAGSNRLDPAWVAGQTRAESSFMPRARSGADARGLMQLLPGTGALTAKRLGIPWLGGESLYEPTTNIRLGTAYLRQMLDRFDGLPYLAIAAYNAGPTPVERWRLARAGLDPDFFIEAIPYKETRDYVARVLAFSVVYDWRLNGDAAPLSERMLGRLVTDARARRPFTCPTPTSVPAP
jgi:soluble lytic murein transglycosylase